MFSVFEDLILKVETVLNNAEFISDNYDLIIRSLDRVNIVLEEYIYLKTESILKYNLYGDCKELIFEGKIKDLKELGFL